MRTAICLFGTIGGTKGKAGDKIGSKEDVFNHAYPHYKEKIINPNSSDVFIHSWSTNREKELVTSLKPVNYIFEDHRSFSKDFNDRKNATLSKYFSVQKVNNLKRKYERQNKIQYDVVMHTRFDLIWFSKVLLKQNFENKYIFFPNWNTSINDDNLGPFRRDNVNVGSRLFDAWFFTSSKISDRYTKIYKNRKKLFKLSDNSWSAHKFAYIQSEINGYEIKNTLYRGHDYELYRRYIQKDWKGT